MGPDLLVVANPVWETAHLVERIPEDEDLEILREARSRAAADGRRVSDGGGSALNSACALAVAGRQVLAVGRVGDDEPGHACLEALRRRGVQTACEVLPGRATKRNDCFVEQGTHATAFVVELPSRAVPPWEETPGALREARVLLLDRLAVGAPAWLQARTRTLGEVPDALPVNALVRNTAILPPAARSRFESALPDLGYLQLPEDAAGDAPHWTSGPFAATVSVPGVPRSASPLDEAFAERHRVHRPRPLPPLAPAEVAALFAAGVHLLARTRGAQGVIVQTSGGPPIELAAVPTEIVDPTGAGDAFAAGLLDALLDALDPVAAARRGLDWAARACRHLGARSWLDLEPPERR